MKRLSIVLLLLGLAGCSYSSMKQAKDACWWWKDGDVFSRSCEEEIETKQYLGLVDTGSKEGPRKKVVKNFRY